jgi:hypothetical protein
VQSGDCFSVVVEEDAEVRLLIARDDPLRLDLAAADRLYDIGPFEFVGRGDNSRLLFFGMRDRTAPSGLDRGVVGLGRRRD